MDGGVLLLGPGLAALVLQTQREFILFHLSQSLPKEGHLYLLAGKVRALAQAIAQKPHPSFEVGLPRVLDGERLDRWLASG